MAKPAGALEARFIHVIYSPHGGIDGALLGTEAGSVQLVFERRDEESPMLFASINEGQIIVVEADPQDPSPKGEGVHPVFVYRRLRTVDGRPPPKPKAATDTAYRGTVVRFNYARHGAPNGVVLDTGDFIHTKPEGLIRLKLKIGDAVRAEGDAQLLSNGRGWAVEATTVNGKSVA